MTSFRWAILGTGMVSRKFLLGLRSSAFDAQVAVVASRTRANAEAFARDFKVSRVAESYEAACRSPEVDAVYVATPPTLHEQQALMAIAAGKPVLVEKPFAMSAAEARRIADAAQTAGVFCMEGMWTRFLPLTRHLKQLVEDGAIGDLRQFSGSYAQANRPDAGGNIFSAALGGGALMHRGVYPLSMACHLLGPVSEAQTLATFGDSGVDEDTTVVCRHRCGLSTINTSLRTSAGNDCRVMGTKGMIHVESPIYRPYRLRLQPITPAGAAGRADPAKEALKEGAFAHGLQQRARGLIGLLRGRGGKAVTRRYTGNGYHYEADEVIRCVREGRRESALLPLSDSVMVMEALDQVRAAWGGAIAEPVSA